MAIDVETLGAAKSYVEETLQGAGALKGEDGADGKSAYQIALDNGFVGSEQEWLESLKADAPTSGGGDLSGYATETFVEEFVEEKINEIEIPDEYDDTELSNRVKANEDAIATLNGSGEGSVSKTVDNALNEFASKISNDGVVNTYKELVDYAAEHSSDIAEMVGDVDAIDTRLEAVETNLGGHTVKEDVPEGAKFTDTTYTEFGKSGADASSGLVPAPSTTAGTSKYLREDGTWVQPPGTTTNIKLGNGYAFVGNGNETAIAVTLSGYTLSTWGRVTIRFQNKVPAGSTLNINSKGAKPIYYKGAAIEDNAIYAGDVCTFMYTGSAYELIDIWYGTGANLGSAVARSASIPANQASPLSANYMLLGLTSTGLYRFSCDAVAEGLAPLLTNELDIGNKTNRVANASSRLEFWANQNDENNHAYIEVVAIGTSTTDKYADKVTFYVGTNGGRVPPLVLHETSVYPGYNNEIDLGTPNNRWSSSYFASEPQVTSDRNQKKDIVSLDADKSTEFIMGLNPVSYKFIDGKSGRTHWGMISQEVEELLKRLGMTSLDFAGFTKAPKTDEDGNVIEGEYNYFLRYAEFIAPLIKVVQNQQSEIEDLKESVAELKAIVEELRK